MSKEGCINTAENVDQHSRLATENTSPHTVITIGDMKYDIDVSLIPYLSSFADFQAKAQSQANELVHGHIPLFDEALRGILSGYRHCFRAIPPDLDQYHTLCETYDFLGIDVLGGQCLDEIVSDLKSCKTEYELEYKYYRATKGNKSKSRDAAFKLLYLILLGEFRDEKKDSAKVFNTVLFIVSHSATFKRRARVSIQAAYEERFFVSAKQKAARDKWQKDDYVGQRENSDEDITTEEESSDWYNSDCS